MNSGTPSLSSQARAWARKHLKPRLMGLRQQVSRPFIPLLFREKTTWLGVTYDNEPVQDGAGAQLHRIYATYALSRLLKLQYIHSPLKRIRYQGLTALERNTEDPELVNRYNEIFHIPSDVELPVGSRICTVRQPGVYTLWKLKREAKRHRQFTLVRCLLPYGIQESLPDSYLFAREVTPFKAPRSKPTPVRVAVHLRRGELYAVDSHRMLPNAYYIAVANGVRAALESLQLEYVIELYGELPTKSFHVTPQSLGFAERIDRPILMDPAKDQIEDFDALPHLQRFINLDAITSLERMATADILIMSRSSFSFLAALLNPRGVALYHPFWHAAPRSWVRTNLKGDFSRTIFLQRLSENGLG